MTESFNNGVVLCKCHGHITERLPLDEICQFLEQQRSDVKVALADDLCQSGTLPQFVDGQELRPWVVGACEELKHKRHFWHEAKGLGCDTYSLRIVDLLRETRSSLGATAIAERAKLLLWAQVARRSEFQGVRQDKLRLHLSSPEGKMSRRDLLMLALPRYEVVPFIEPERCRGQQGCRICVDTCPVKALKVEADKVVIDTAICNGCGVCTHTCPQRAIVYPAFSLEELDKELEGLLLPKDVALQSRIIAAVCQRCLAAPGVELPTYPPNVLPVKVPCLALVSPWLILRAFDLGTQGFALVSGRGKCRCGFDSSQWQDKVRFVKGLLECWNIGPERVRVFEVETDTTRSVEGELSQFAEEITRLKPTPLGSDTAPLTPEGWPLPGLIKHMGNRLNNSPGRIVSVGAVPFGKVELDASECSGCGVCALECTTEALTVLSIEATGGYQLLFRHDCCIACGRCVEVCPERCLRFERVLELDRMDGRPTVLFEDAILRCYRCGSPVAPRAMIDKLQAKLSGSESPPSYLRLCPNCRIKSQFGLSSVAPEHAEAK